MEIDVDVGIREIERKAEFASGHIWRAVGIARAIQEYVKSFKARDNVGKIVDITAELGNNFDTTNVVLLWYYVRKEKFDKSIAVSRVVECANKINDGIRKIEDIVKTTPVLNRPYSRHKLLIGKMINNLYSASYLVEEIAEYIDKYGK